MKPFTPIGKAASAVVVDLKSRRLLMSQLRDSITALEDKEKSQTLSTHRYLVEQDQAAIVPRYPRSAEADHRTLRSAEAASRRPRRCRYPRARGDGETQRDQVRGSRP